MTESFVTFPFVSSLSCPLLGRATRQVMWTSFSCLRIEENKPVDFGEHVQLGLRRGVGARAVGDARAIHRSPRNGVFARRLRGGAAARYLPMCNSATRSDFAAPKAMRQGARQTSTIPALRRARWPLR